MSGFFRINDGSLLNTRKRLCCAPTSASVPPICPKTPSANSGATRTSAGHGASFENWRASLKWQRLKPHRKFAATKTTGRELPPAQSSQLTDLLANTGGDGRGRANIKTGVSRIGGRGLARFHRFQRYHRLITHFERALADLAE